MDNLLKLEKVSYIYHSKTNETLALKEIEFSVKERELVGIVGPSGCGKTTILSLLAKLLKPSSGHIYLGGQPLEETENMTALMPQRDQLFEWRTIIRNVTLGLEIQKNLNDAGKEYARVLLKKYGLGDFEKKHPSELSGGMRQRAALIRTLVTQPKLLLLDEPFSALDFQTRLKVVDDVHSIIKAEKKTAILVSHDISEAISVCDKIIVLSARPATVTSMIDIHLGKELSPLKRRENKDFSLYFEKIWKKLEEQNERRT